MLKNCPECSGMVSDQASFCPQRGLDWLHSEMAKIKIECL